MESADKLPYDKVLVVCDRGTLDGKAFVSKKDFNRAFGAIINATKEAVIRDFGI